jgi:hypothetical protein
LSKAGSGNSQNNYQKIMSTRLLADMASGQHLNNPFKIDQSMNDFGKLSEEVERTNNKSVDGKLPRLFKNKIHKKGVSIGFARKMKNLEVIICHIIFSL